MVTNPTKICTDWSCHNLSIKYISYFKVEINFCWICGHFRKFEKIEKFSEIWHSDLQRLRRYFEMKNMTF